MGFSCHYRLDVCLEWERSRRKFYEWLDSTTGRLLPEGPPVWICGDCHLGNLGPVANVQGRVEIAIRDLDQTVIGNPAHDLIRLGLSLATAIRGSDLPGVTTALMLEQIMAGYKEGLVGPGTGRKKSTSPPKPVRRVLERALKRRWRHLAEEHIKDVTPVIPLGKNFWPLSAVEKREIDAIFNVPEVHRLMTSLKGCDQHEKVKVLDAAYWRKGCSSLGRLRFAVLLEIGKKKRKTERFCLVDIKEAVQAAAPHSVDAAIPKDHALRVVEGARKLSPLLGNRMLAWRFQDRAIVLRELLPQDLKLKMDQLTREEAIGAARFLASVVGKAHASQMSHKTKVKWRADLNRNHSKKLDAPSWLWTSVVELVASHEAAYLEHCRLYAMQGAASTLGRAPKL